GQRLSDVARGLARLQVRVVQNGEEIECSTTEREPVNLAELQITPGIDADEKKIGVARMEGDEVANVGLKTTDFLTAGIKGMNQADLISRVNVAGVAGA